MASNSIPSSVASDEFNTHRVILLAPLVLFNVLVLLILVTAGSQSVCNVEKFESTDIEEVSFTFDL